MIFPVYDDGGLVPVFDEDYFMDELEKISLHKRLIIIRQIRAGYK